MFNLIGGTRRSGFSAQGARRSPSQGQRPWKLHVQVELLAQVAQFFRPKGPGIRPARANGPGSFMFKWNCWHKSLSFFGPRGQAFAQPGPTALEAEHRGTTSPNGATVPQSDKRLPRWGESSQGRWPWLGERLARWAERRLASCKSPWNSRTRKSLTLNSPHDLTRYSLPKDLE